jgi:hypothetical protein
VSAGAGGPVMMMMMFIMIPQAFNRKIRCSEFFKLFEFESCRRQMLSGQRLEAMAKACGQDLRTKVTELPERQLVCSEEGTVLCSCLV